MDRPPTETKARDHLVREDQGAVPMREARDRLEEPGAGRDDTHIPCHRLDHDRGDRWPVALEQLGEPVGVVVASDERLSHDRERDPRGIRERLGRNARAGTGEQSVRVPVIPPGELYHLGPVSESPRDPNGTHDRLGAGAHEPKSLERRSGSTDPLGELVFERGGGSEREPPEGGPPHRRHDPRGSVPEEIRAPGAHEVEEASAIDIDEIRPPTTGEEHRGPTHRPKRPHRTVNTSDKHLAGATAEGARAAPRGGGVHGRPPDRSTGWRAEARAPPGRWDGAPVTWVVPSSRMGG